MNLEHDALMIEKEIDAALKLLNETQPPAQMASRIHLSLETTIAARGQTYRGPLFWVPATCAAVAAVLLLVFFQTHWTRGTQLPAVETAKIAADSVSQKIASSRPESAPEHSHERDASITNVHQKPHRRTHAQYRHAANLFNYPLTRQEKLLLQFAATAKPEDLRDLNPEYQAKVEAQQEAEFLAYVKSGTQKTKTSPETN
ncbi:MAG TPA: hypothetical protein VN670_10145 [Acidobacteriaceae bacterium]|nr:hypothetical protein [Acidobacteriaceae bacterium]